MGGSEDTRRKSEQPAELQKDRIVTQNPSQYQCPDRPDPEPHPQNPLTKTPAEGQKKRDVPPSQKADHETEEDRGPHEGPEPTKDQARDSQYEDANHDH